MMGILKGRNKSAKKRIAVFVAPVALTVVGVFLLPSPAYAATTGWWWPDYVGYPGGITLSNVDNSYGSPIHSYSNTYRLSISDTTGKSTYHNGSYYQAREDFYVFNGNGGETEAHGIHTDWITTTTLNTGYHEVALADLQSWTSLLKGNWGYINSLAEQEYATVSGGIYGSLQVISLGHLLGAFGAYKPPNLDDMCDTYYSSNKYEVLGSPIVTSDPPQGSISADQPVIGQGNTENLSTTVKDDTWGNTSHRESVLITGPNGYYKWIYGSADDSNYQNYNSMGWRSGGGPSVSQAQVSCSSAAHAPWETWNNTYNFNTGGLAPGTYTAHFYSMDWARRGSGEATTNFNVVSASIWADSYSNYTNQGTTLHAQWYGPVPSDYRLVIIDANTGQGIAWGGWGSSTLSTWVNEGTATTQNYYVVIQQNNTWSFAYSSGQIAVTWNWPTVYITASPSSLYTNQSTDITASVPAGTLNSSQMLVIYDSTAGAYYTDPAYGQTSYTIHVTEETATTHTFTAYIRSTSSGYLSGDENSVNVTWNWPSVTVSANPTQLTTGSKTTLTASVPAGTLPPGYKLTVWDNTDGGNVIGWGLPGVTTLSGTTTNYTPGSHQYVGEITDSTGHWVSGTGWNGGGTSTTVTWDWPRMTISANPQSLLTGQTSAITASVPSGTLDSSHGLAIVNITNSPNNVTVVSGPMGQDSVTYDATEGKATTQKYDVCIIDSSGSGVDCQNADGTPNSTSVTWNWPSLSIWATPSSLPVGTATQLYADLQSGTSIDTGHRLMLYDATSNTRVAYGGWGSRFVSTQVTESTPTTQVYKVYITDASGNIVSGGTQVSVTWNKFTLTGAEVDHTAAWLKNLQAWNQQNPNQTRTLGTFWAGEEFIFKVKSNSTSTFSYGTVSFTPQYSSYVPMGAPLTVTLPLVWNSTDGAYEAHTDPNDSTYFQYLQNGTYTATFTATTTYGAVTQAQATFSIQGPWTDYWQQSQVW